MKGKENDPNFPHSVRVGTEEGLGGESEGRSVSTTLHCQWHGGVAPEGDRRLSGTAGGETLRSGVLAHAGH